MYRGLHRIVCMCDMDMSSENRNDLLRRRKKKLGIDIGIDRCICVNVALSFFCIFVSGPTTWSGRAKKCVNYSVDDTNYNVWTAHAHVAWVPLPGVVA